MTDASAEGAQPARSAAELREWLLGAVARRIDGNPHTLDPRERFSRLGIDSLKAAGVTAELSELVGRPLPRTLFWDYPTIDAVVAFLMGQAAKTAVATASPISHLRVEEPIAVVGVACRFPLAPDPEAFWRLMVDGVDAIREVPADRWDLERYFSPDPSKPGRMSTRWGGFLDGVDRFDPQFFGISPREAMQMDPQQRLMLELAWESLEDAGIVAEGLKDSLTGVYIGAMWSDYARLIAGKPSCITQHTATGQDTSIIPARVSYTFGLQGPSVAVNTACSSSLVAVHLACQALRAGEATLAMAGAVNMVLSPDSTVAMSKFGGMAPDGRSKAFDARANGYVRGEGGGIVVLKPLSQAIRDGDRIYCVVLGSAVNNDGFSNGLTAPNPQAQEEMLRLAYGRAGVSPHDVDYVETHGTGTLLGDPIEAGAIGRVLGEGRPSDRPVLIGSVKTNIGHLEAAAGMAGFIKVALALHRGHVPGNLHFETPNPNIDFEGLHVAVQRGGPWPVADRPAIAGVSSFGFGGTNCHVVAAQRPLSTTSYVLPLAAGTAAALQDAVAAARNRLSAGDDLAGICGAAAADVVVAAAAHRAAFTARSTSELAAQLGAFAGGQALPGVAAGVASPAKPRLVWVLSPHGGQWAGMGRQLFAEEPVFRATLQRAAAAIQREAGWDLIAELLADESRSRLSDVGVTQPAIFAIQAALAALWRSWGVEPDAVVGHSMGEVAAAHVAGVLDLDDAVTVICHRSRLLATTAGRGALAMVGLSAASTSAALAGRGGLWIVAFNSPASTLVSGEPEPLAVLLSDLEREGVFCRRVRVDVAAHSPHMDALLDELFAAVRRVRPSRGVARVYSTVEGNALPGESFDASYWVRNLRQPVLFAQAVDKMLDEGPAVFLELGPHPVLAPALQQSIAHAGIGHVIETLRRGEDERAAMLDAAGRLFVLGAASTSWSVMLGVPDAAPAGSELLVLSAHTPAALSERASAVATQLRQPSAPPLADVCYTAAVRRSAQAHRLAAVARTGAEMADYLDAFVAGEPRTGVSAGERRVAGLGRIAFVFPGQGSQWIGMGRRLLEQESIFRAAIESCDAAISEIAGWSLVDELAAPPDRSRLSDRIDIIQPSLSAIQIALAALWRSWGVEPSAVVGHSMGEVAAAHVAGVLSLADAMRIICRRSRLLRQVSGKGAMAVVELSMADADAALDGFRDRLAVAASNSRRSTVLSGDPVALDALTRDLEGRGIFCRHVKVDVASHSPQMDPLRDELLGQLSDVVPQAGSLPIYSTVAGAPLDGTVFSAEYWARNLREPVLFSSSVSTLIADGFDTFIEVSAHPLLLPSVEESIADSGQPGIVVASLRRDEDERTTLLASVGSLFCHGHRLEWDRVNPKSGRIVPLPPYPWQRGQFWLELGESDETPREESGGSFIGQAVRPAGLGVSTWEFDLTLRRLGEAADAAPRFLTGAELQRMAEAAAGEVMDVPFTLADVRRGRSIELTAQSRHQGQIVLAPEAEGLHTLTILQRDLGEPIPMWRAMFTATVQPGGDVRVPETAGVPADRDSAQDRLLYAVNWRQSPLVPSEGRHPHSWLLLRDRQGLADQLCERLSQTGARSLVVESDFTAEGAAARIAAMFSASAVTPSSFDAIVALSPIDLPAGEDLDPERVDDAFEQGTLGALRLVQELLRTDLATTPRLYFVTRGAQAAGGFVTAVTSSPLWGLASVIAVEHPEFRCTRIDLEDVDDRPVDLLAAELEADSDDDMVAVRGGQRFVARLERRAASEALPAPRPPSNAPEPGAFDVDVAADAWRLCLPSSCCSGRVMRAGAGVKGLRAGDEVLADCGGAVGDHVRVDATFVHSRPTGVHVQTARLESLAALVPSLARPAINGMPFSGTCVVTGGAGGLGLVTASWMVERGARHLVLLGRRPPTPEASQAIDRMIRAGASVRAVAADVASEQDLMRVFDDIDRTSPPLCAIVHAAGVLDDAVVATMDAAQFRAVIRTKARGAWLLHRMSVDRPVEFFVMYSSVLSYLGAAGQANHAAANAFLDALAHFRRGLGLSGLSVNWGPWSDVGLAAARGGRGDRLASMGLGSLTPAEGRAVLDRVFEEPRAQLSVMRFDVEKWCGQTSRLAGTSLFTGLRAEQPALSIASQEIPLRARIEGLQGGVARRAAMETYVQEVVARVLRLPAASVDPDKPVRSMGLDSLMAIELRNRLEAGTGAAIPTTLIWNYPTVSRLAPEVASRMGLPLEADSGHAASTAPSLAAAAGVPLGQELEELLGELEELTNDQAASMLGVEPTRGPRSDV